MKKKKKRGGFGINLPDFHLPKFGGKGKGKDVGLKGDVSGGIDVEGKCDLQAYRSPSRDVVADSSALLKFSCMNPNF